MTRVPGALVPGWAEALAHVPTLCGSVEGVATLTRAETELRDAADELAPLRAHFELPEGRIYLVGNSLGPPRRGMAARLISFVEDEWGRELVGGWNKAQWIDAPTRVGNHISTILGAAAGQIIVGDSTTIQLYRCLSAALGMRRDRNVVLMEAENFPADSYIAEGLVRELNRAGRKLELRACPQRNLEAAIEDAGTELAVVTGSHVDYRTARVADLAGLTRAAHRHGALCVWDLAHSAGLLPVGLDAMRADFAVGCTYKYLNGGPGSPAFAYIAGRHHRAARSPTWGWLGHARPFAFEDRWKPAEGPRSFLCGTPAVASTAALEFALEVLDGLSFERVYAKARALTDTFLEALEAHGALAPTGGDDEDAAGGEELRLPEDTMTLASPRAAEARGGHVALAHPNAYALSQALREAGVEVDFRAPSHLRFAFAPLYTRFVDAWDAARAVAEELHSKNFTRPEYQSRSYVT